VDFKEARCKVLEWVCMAQDSEIWWTPHNMEMNIRFHKREKLFDHVNDCWLLNMDSAI
jgi:hypothetical protein